MGRRRFLLRREACQPSSRAVGPRFRTEVSSWEVRRSIGKATCYFWKPTPGLQISLGRRIDHCSREKRILVVVETPGRGGAADLRGTWDRLRSIKSSGQGLPHRKDQRKYGVRQFRHPQPSLYLGGSEGESSRSLKAWVVAAFNAAPSEVRFGAYEAKRRASRPSLVYRGDDESGKGVAVELIRDVSLIIIAPTPSRSRCCPARVRRKTGGPELAYRFEWFRKRYDQIKRH
jgi:hypothetical protein